MPQLDGSSGRSEKGKPRTSDAHVPGKSDDPIVPQKQPNNGGEEPSAEAVEGRGSTKGNDLVAAACRTQDRIHASRGLQGVREYARREKGAKLTTLLHHVTALLEDSFYALKRDAAPGVDGVTWREYEEDLTERLQELHEKIHRGSYRAQPSKRTYIPKPDGRKRPLGIAALEDKIAQQAVRTVVEAIFEEDFLGFSYGFRPGRSAHDALDALWVGIMHKKVNWVLDADIRGFFDTIDHGWLLKFLEHRIADRRVLRLIRKWLRAGVSEDGQWSKTTVGTPQGAVISPLLANVYLHYVLDLWVQWWRTHEATGDVIIVRYADDFVVGFQHRTDAERFAAALEARLERFGLALHPDKTRLLEFGRFAAEHRAGRGEGKPETFDFLGFTHMCGKTQKAKRFIVRRKTSKKRLRAKLKDLRMALMRRRHQPVAELGRWLRRVVTGYFNYHAVPDNSPSLELFRQELLRLWLRALRRRSQRKHRMTWERFCRFAESWLPKPRVLHPYPNQRFYAKHPR